MTRKHYLIATFFLLLAFYSGMKYENFFLARKYNMILNEITRIYQNNVGGLEHQLRHERYPNGGANNEKYSL